MQKNLSAKKIVFLVFATACCRLMHFIAYKLHPRKISNLHSSIDKILTGSQLNFEADLLINSLVVAEDHRFFFHEGIDPFAIFRASIKTLIGHMQGASTIEQQLVRTITKDYEKTLRRKLREALLASTLRRRFTKREVAWTYLLIAYFGEHQQQTDNYQELLAAHKDLIAALSLVSQLKYPKKLNSSSSNSYDRRNRTNYLLNRVRKVDTWLPN